jgi:IMP dehydrogenase
MIELDFPLSLGFDDVGISQTKNLVKSRLDVDISSEIIRGVKVNIPMIASNMSSVINRDFYLKLIKAGAFGILHRADSPQSIIDDCKYLSKECEWVAASIGVGNDQFDFAKNIIKAGANIICIDVAHGYADYIAELGRKIKTTFSNVKLIVGNTTNSNMLIEYADFADAVKVGIAVGAACDTKIKAGAYEKQFSAVLKFKELSKKYNIPVISDGGIRCASDVVKAIGAGANSIMAGSLFAKCKESAADIEMINDQQKKVYFGMASERAQKNWFGKSGLKAGTCAEGKVVYLDVEYSLAELLNEYSGAMRTGFTYGSGKDIKSFQENVKFVRFK